MYILYGLHNGVWRPYMTFRHFNNAMDALAALRPMARACGLSYRVRTENDDAS